MPDAHPCVSIVIPAYNAAAYLAAAVDSVLAQDYRPVELIVLDDGSTDATPQVLGRYQGRLRWASHPNMGQARTLNEGWRLAGGTLLGYLSADDVLHPGAVGALVDALRAHPDASLAYGDYQLVDAAGRVVQRVAAPAYSYRDLVVRAICQPGPGVLFRRGALEAAGGWDGAYRLVPDYEFYLRLSLQGRFVRVPAMLASLRVHAASQSFARADRQASDEQVRALRAYFRDQPVPPPIAAARAEALANAHVVAAASHLRSGRQATAAARLLTAVRLHPGVLLRGRSYRLLGHGLGNRARHALRTRLARRRAAPAEPPAGAARPAGRT